MNQLFKKNLKTAFILCFITLLSQACEQATQNEEKSVSSNVDNIDSSLAKVPDDVDNMDSPLTSVPDSFSPGEDLPPNPPGDTPTSILGIDRFNSDWCHTQESIPKLTVTLSDEINFEDSILTTFHASWSPATPLILETNYKAIPFRQDPVFSLNYLVYACLSYKPMYTHYIDGEDRYFIGQPKEKPKGVVFLFAGYTQDEYNYMFYPHASLPLEILKKGYAVVLTNLPFNSRINLDEFSAPDANNGEKYAQTFKNTLDKKINFYVQKFGKIDNLILGGVSYGGLHALAGACFRDEVKLYMAGLPVVKIEVLANYLFSSKNFFPTADCITKLSNKKGVIVYGDQDYRVNFNDAIELSKKIKDIQSNALTEVRVVDLDHTTTYDVIREMVSLLP